MAEVTKRIYLVKTTKEAPGEATRLVNAPNAAQALRHVVESFLTVELASPAQCVTLGAAGVKVEDAS